MRAPEPQRLFESERLGMLKLVESSLYSIEFDADLDQCGPRRASRLSNSRSALLYHSRLCLFSTRIPALLLRQRHSLSLVSLTSSSTR